MTEHEELIAYGCVADDDSGATDEAGMLADAGIRVILLVDIPDVENLARHADGFDAVVLASKTRALSPEEAKSITTEAMKTLVDFGAHQYKIKYCSTFDSTEEGNIGPSIDAAMDVLAEPLTTVVPALPVNGRTTYMGYHFVGRQLISDSPMKDHPLTPMRNPNLVDLLGHQTQKKVGLIPHDVVRSGAGAIDSALEEARQRGEQMLVVDCVAQEDLVAIAEAIQGYRLVTGGSGISMELPRFWRERGWCRHAPLDRGAREAQPGGPGVLAVAGSCSAATRRQNEAARSTGFTVLPLDAARVVEGHSTLEIEGKAVELLVSGKDVLIPTSSPPEDIQRVQELGRKRGLTGDETGKRITTAVSDLVTRIFARTSLNKLIVAGGETSGAVVRRLGIEALEVCQTIDPGVPLNFSRGAARLGLVLKSGNFGCEEFYHKAAEVLRERTKESNQPETKNK